MTQKGLAGMPEGQLVFSARPSVYCFGEGRVLIHQVQQSTTSTQQEVHSDALNL